MPVYYEKLAAIDEFLRLKVDAIVVPIVQDSPKLPKFTQYIYKKAGYDKIQELYHENKGNAFWWTEHFPDFSPDEYKAQTDRMSENDPIVTVTEGCGVNCKYIFHIAIGLPEDYCDITPESDPELYEKISNQNWSEEEIIYKFDDIFDPDSESCRILRRCYETVLYCAQKRGIQSIAFPIIGAEDNSDFTFPMAYYVAHTAPQEWLKFTALFKNTGDNTLGKTNKPKEEMTIRILDLPDSFKINFDPTPNITEEDETDERKKRFKSFERRLKESIKNSGMTPEKYAKTFIWECLADVNINKLHAEIDYDPTRLKNGQLKKPAPHRIIAIAAALELSDFDRFALIHCAGHTQYPSTKFDFDVEDAFKAGARGFDALKKALIEKGYPKDVLTAKVRGSKQNKTEE